MTKRITEQRNAARAGGRFANMHKCEMCGRGGELEPAFGGDGTLDNERDPAWGKLICVQRCAPAARLRVAGLAGLQLRQLRAIALRFCLIDECDVVGAPALRRRIMQNEIDALVLPGSYATIAREEGLI